MSQLLIQRYLNELADLQRVSGTRRESVVREAFKGLLKDWGKSQNLVFAPEYPIETPQKREIRVDGALLHELRVPFGYWEAKDEEDDLDREIEKKLRRGYPQDNIIFEDSREAVLWQHRQEVMRCPVDEVDRLKTLLDLYFGYERPEIAGFRKAVEQFKTDLPAVLAGLRDMIDRQYQANAAFRDASGRFLARGQETINPSLTDADVREMLIQHILTEDIFARVFGDADFHRQNNVAKELYALESAFFTGPVKKATLAAMEPYYAAIRAAAAQISSHNEKQAFLKAIYENFYKVYNKKAADRLGVVYTPNEIVRFMIEGTDWLCQTHFGKRLIDEGVEILDPATGTGTFVAGLIEHFRGQKAKLRHKYLEELHANEVAILPYYVANLNIEATYAAVTGEYLEFPNLCFVDTLDNVAALRKHKGQMDDLFGAVSAENVARIKRQNGRTISVIIGNPPYNANQLNENENNKNRQYPEIDRRVKATYVAASAAQKPKTYDMYARFFRWASDRVAEDGIVSFITNRGFLTRYTYDGFRKTIGEEFSHIYVIDLGGDARDDLTLSGTRHNVFGIRTGVAISFMVKSTQSKEHSIRYMRRPQYETREEKLAFLANSKSLDASSFDNIYPNHRNDWIDQSLSESTSSVPIVDKLTKLAKNDAQSRAVFKLYSLGISTNRDEWLYDRARSGVATKARHLVSIYDKISQNVEVMPNQLKWSETLVRRKRAGEKEQFDRRRIRQAAYRPFSQIWLYHSVLFIDRPASADELFPVGSPIWQNRCIVFTDPTAQKPWLVLAVSSIVDLHYVGAAAGTVCLPSRRLSGSDMIDNITDWALGQFRDHYGSGIKSPVNKDAIFHYVYAVLHDPVYRDANALNLKKEFPRIPFYEDFWRWAEWGERLMDLHIGYETVEPWPLGQLDVPDERSRAAGLPPKPILKADKINGIIQLDSETQLSGVPAEAWSYKLGNRTALEWVLDQHKEKTPKDPTIRERFNTYRFADHKEKVIDLLKRVTRVSVETVAITEAMRALPRGG